MLQACKGSQLDAGVPVYIEEDGRGVTRGIRLPSTADFCVMYSTVPGKFASYLRWFI